MHLYTIVQLIHYTYTGLYVYTLTPSRTAEGGGEVYFIVMATVCHQIALRQGLWENHTRRNAHTFHDQIKTD